MQSLWWGLLAGLLSFRLFSPILLMLAFIYFALNFHRRWIGLYGCLLGLLLDFSAQQNSLPKVERVATYELVSPILQVKPRSQFSASSFQTKIRKIVSTWFGSTTGEVQSFRRILFLGDTKDWSFERWQLLNHWGLSHFFVVSGAHLSLIILFCSFLCGRIMGFLCRNRTAYRLSLVVTILFIVQIFPAGISLYRAFILFIVTALIPELLPHLHRYYPHERLALVGVIVALWDPLICTSPSYLLSFFGCWFLVVIQTWQMRPPHWQSALYPGLGLWFLLMALGLFAHPLSFLSTLLATPFLIVISILALVSLLIRALEPLTGSFIESFFHLLSGLTEIIPRFGHPESLPASVYVTSFIIILALYESRRLPSKMKLGIMFTLLTLLIGLSFGAFSRNEGVSLQIIDAGQGDAFFLNLEGKLVGIDGGNPHFSFQWWPFLRRTPDLWLLSHFDRDHSGTFLELIGTLKPHEIWIPRWDHSKVAQKLRRYPQKFQTVKDHLIFCSENFCLRGLAMIDRPPFKPVKNADSLILVLYEKRNLLIRGLFLGDLPGRLEQKIPRELLSLGFRLPVSGPRLLKVAHHGSASSTFETFVRWYRPTDALVTCGRSNSYQFPSDRVMRVLEAHGTRILRQDLMGNFKVIFDFSETL